MHIRILGSLRIAWYKSQKNCQFLAILKNCCYLCTRNACEVRLHLGNEQARCSRFALTLAVEMLAKLFIGLLYGTKNWR